MTKDRSVMNLGWLSLFILFFMMASAFSTYAAAPAGFSQYYIPGPEEQMLELFESIGSGSQGTTMHSIITVTVWSDNTVIYYDHWENGYGFDPDNPATTADETYFNVTPSSRGDSQTFESANIPSSPRLDTATFYDGMDRIYVAGGPATVTRASWPEADGTLFSVAWEVYPIRPQLVKYILPFGEELATAQYDTTFRDEFSTVSYSNNDGDNNWAGDWIEEGEVSPDTNGDPPAAEFPSRVISCDCTVNRVIQQIPAPPGSLTSPVTHRLHLVLTGVFPSMISIHPTVLLWKFRQTAAHLTRSLTLLPGMMLQLPVRNPTIFRHISHQTREFDSASMPFMVQGLTNSLMSITFKLGCHRHRPF